MKYLILALIYLILIFSIYKITYYFKQRKNKEILYKMLEVSFLEQKYHLDIRKIGLPKILNIIAATNTIIFTITLLATMPINNFIFKFLTMFVILFPLIFIFYHIIGTHYQKKGMTKSV
ncbi:MAG: hypothetical protein PHQ89_03115 [Bacilli bacterium]|nr:hypothetical protein [Bacilli bacterium]